MTKVGAVVSSRELQGAAGGASEWARRLRELRDEEGFRVLSHNDRSDLKPGEYLLENEKPDPAFARTISKKLRSQVLERNGFTCQMCGAAAGEQDPYNKSKKVRLHIGHVIDKSKGGDDTLQNLRALCSVCNEGAKNITAMKPDLKHLLVELRRAKSEDQREALDWLARKFHMVVKAEK